jgi:hypothetical protein
MQKKETIYDMAMGGARKSGHRPSQDRKINYWREFVMTFSNQKSLFSSKKMERFVVFWTFLSLTVYYIVKNIHEMDSLEFIEVIGLWLAYGGYNSMLNLRDRKIDTSHAQAPASGQPAEEPSTEPC